MQFTIKIAKITTLLSDCLVVGVFEAHHLTESAEHLDKVSKGHLSRMLKKEDFSGKVGHTLLLHDVPNITAARVMLVGCGDPKNIDDHIFRRIIGRAIAAVNSTGAKEAISYLSELDVKNRAIYWKIRQSIECISDAVYSFNEFKSKKNSKQFKLHAVAFGLVREKDKSAANKAIQDGVAITDAMQLVKNLGNLPANVCTPTYIAKQAQQLAKQQKSLKVRILEAPELKKLGMGALLAVAKGSHEPPKLITLQYNGGKKTAKTIVFVGKGVTFDTGGISLKPPPLMDEMKYDMCGAATVLGVMQAAAKLRLPINLVGVIPTVENMPGGGATRPGDIVKTLSGQTVEILNTDAEGRLILCDALTYSERFNPDIVIDIATLTGAIVVALGNMAAGLFTNDEPLAKALLEASSLSADRIWRMPLWEEYGESLSSNFADIANVGAREAGSSIAAYYLSQFTKKFHWAHLDVAGTAWKSGKEKGATGRPVPLLVQFLLDQC